MTGVFAVWFRVRVKGGSPHAAGSFEQPSFASTSSRKDTLVSTFLPRKRSSAKSKLDGVHSRHSDDYTQA